MRGWNRALARWSPLAAALVALWLVGSVPVARQALVAASMAVDSWWGVGRSLSVYEPSAWPVVDAIIERLELDEDDVVVDIGSGDGRIVIAAAVVGARGVGIERQEDLVLRSRDSARMAGVEERAQFLHADALTLPSVVGRATVVVLFLTTQGLEVVVPWLEDGVIAPGTVVVSNTWPVPGWRPEAAEVVTDGVRAWALYVYRFPAGDGYVEGVHGAGR